MKRIAALLAGLIIGSVPVMDAQAKEYPNRPVRLVVPFAPGSATDLLGREIAAGLGPRLGQTVIVDTKPGAGTAIGAQFVANSAPDGYTVLLGTNATFAVNPVLYKKLPYDPVNDFKVIGSAGEMPSFLMVSGQSRFKSLAEFIEHAKANPGALSYASSGVGSTGHLVGEMLSSVAGVKLLHVPFKSGPQGLTAVASGEVDAIFYTSTAAKGMLDAGKVKPIAVSTTYRTQDMPDVPTIEESGYPGFSFVGWLVLAVPKGTPAAVVETLSTAYGDLSADPGFRSKLMEIGIPLRDYASGELQRFVEQDRQRMVDLAAKANIQPE